MTPTAFRAESRHSLNFYVVASLAVSATSTVPGLWTTAGWAYVLDDVVLATVAAFAVAWYVRCNGGRRSLVPVRLLLLAAVTKLIAVSLSHNQGAAYGGDATVAAFLLATVVVTLSQIVLRRRTMARVVRAGDSDLLLDALRQRQRFGRPSTS